MKKPIYSTGDKVYLPQEDDFNDYEIVEINAIDDDNPQLSADNCHYRIKPVKGDQTFVKSESEIFPITA